MITAGRYRARAVEAALGHASTGSPQVAVALQLLDGPDVGEVVNWYGYFTDQTRDGTIASLRCCGWDGEYLADLTSVGRDEGNVVEVVIAVEPDLNGVARARIRWINPVGRGIRMKRKMTADQARDFASTFDRAATKNPSVRRSS